MKFRLKQVQFDEFTSDLMFIDGCCEFMIPFLMITTKYQIEFEEISDDCTKILLFSYEMPKSFPVTQSEHASAFKLDKRHKNNVKIKVKYDSSFYLKAITTKYGRPGVQVLTEEIYLAKHASQVRKNLKKIARKRANKYCK